MPEPFTIAKLKARPTMGTWSVEGNTQEFPGFLYLEGDNLHLTLYFTIGGHRSFKVVQRSDPNLMLFVPPNQPTLHGRTGAAGHVTLFHCSQLSYRALNQLEPPQTRLELTLRPTQAWFGDGFVSAEQKYQDLSFSALGLHNILSTIHVDHRFLVESTPERQSDTHELKKLTGADEAFLVHQAKQPEANIVKGGKTYQVLLTSSISQSRSSVDGISIQTSDDVFIRSEGATFAELMNVCFEVEQFFALLCMGPFRGDRVTLHLDESHSAELLWRLGKPVNSEIFTLMPHQMLVALGRHPDLTKMALENWFKESEAMQLARWLIFDSLFAEVSTTSKFLSVAQAWELTGREESNVAPYDRKKFKEMCQKIEKIIHTALGSEAAERLLGLLQSSNRESFATLVENITSKLPALALDNICGDVPKFVSAVVKTRNALTHMQGSKKLPLETASYLSLFLTYKLIALFCIHACVSAGLPLDNLGMMLGNNVYCRDSI
jgi:ApeA N-terminal domain 1/Apea-like HEPN